MIIVSLPINLSFFLNLFIGANLENKKNIIPDLHLALSFSSFMNIETVVSYINQIINIDINTVSLYIVSE